MALKVAILGGSFNPVHNGHLALADAVLKQYGYDKILFVPAFCPPHKTMTSEASDKQRVKMLQLALKENPAFEIETCELDRKGVSYTTDTIDFLYKKYKRFSVNKKLCGKFGLIIGDDLAKEFYKWKNAQSLTEKTDLIVAHRMFSKDIGNLDSFKYCKLANEIFPISSNEIRLAIKQKKAWRYLVPPKVFNYIKQRELYV